MRDVEDENRAVTVEAEKDAYGAVGGERVCDCGLDQAKLEWRRRAFRAGKKRLQLPHREDERG